MGESAGDDSSIHFAEHRDSSHFRRSRGTLRSVDGCWLMVDGRENDEAPAFVPQWRDYGAASNRLNLSGRFFSSRRLPLPLDRLHFLNQELGKR